MITLNYLKSNLKIEDHFKFLADWGAEPQYTEFGIMAQTICHNQPSPDNSRKLYYYANSELYICYSGCEEAHFDLIELTRKVFRLQRNQELSLTAAINYLANRISLVEEFELVDTTEPLEDWKILENYDRIQTTLPTQKQITLKEYDKSILDRLNYNIKLAPWLNDNISQEVLNFAHIGYYLGGDQITIPHYDADSRLVGLRGRTMSAEEAEYAGKYRPLYINQIWYSHPLGLNLYGLNWAKQQIKQIKKVVVLESEKSVLQYMSYFGIQNSIAVATCGSSLSKPQVELLLQAGAEEIVVAFDKQYPALNTEESKQWSKKLTKLHNKYKNDCLISFLWDKGELLGYKDSPTDRGAETFLQLFKERIIL